MSRTPTPYSERAAYLGIPGVSQKVRRGKAGVGPPPLVPPHAFHAEHERALAADPPAGLIALDLSETLGMRTRATTPSLLGCYVCLAASAEAVTTDFVATSEMYYVVRGEGRSAWGDEAIQWRAGDVFFLPGGCGARHEASTPVATLYAVNDEPLVRFLGLVTPPGGATRIPPVHYLGEVLDGLQQEAFDAADASGVIHFSIDDELAYSSFLPAWKWMKPGEQQEPHQHAPVALQIIMRSGRCHSVVDGQRIDWQDHLVLVTPSGTLHSHHNDGEEPGMYLITQDIPLYKYLRSHWYEEPATQTRQLDWRPETIRPTPMV